MRFDSLRLLLLISALGLACTNSPVATVVQNQSSGGELEQRLKIICDRAQGTVGLSLVHIESGKTIVFNDKSQLPLYSVFKLPLAITVMKDI